VLPETIATSIKVNDIFIPCRQIEDWLGLYSVNLFIWTHWDDSKVRLVGSASPVLYRGEYLLICTGHQIRDADPKDICILTSGGDYAITSSGFARPPVGSDGREVDLQDIVIFTFTPACEANYDLRKLFFPFRAVPPDCTSDKVIAVINYGFPSQDQLFELYDKNHIGSRRRKTLLKPGMPCADETLLHLRPTTPLTFDPDGLSGGPNFVVQRDGNDFEAFFAGVTVRGGRNDLYVIKSGYIKMLLDASIDERS